MKGQAIILCVACVWSVGWAKSDEQTAKRKALEFARRLGESPVAVAELTAKSEFDSRPKRTQKWLITSKRWQASVDEHGELVGFRSHTNYGPWLAGKVRPVLSTSVLREKALKIARLVWPRQSRLPGQQGGISGGPRNSKAFGFTLTENKDGFEGGQSASLSLDAHNGRLLDMITTSAYPYSKTKSLISKEMAVGRAREFWQRNAPAKEGKWPGDAAVLSKTGRPRWQWPWKLWNSAGTKTSLARGQWELAYILDVNDYYVHVNAHNGEIMGGQRRPFSEPRPRTGTTQLQPVNDSPPVVTTPSRMPGGMVGQSAEVDPGPFVAAGAVGGVGLAALAISALRRIQRP